MMDYVCRKQLFAWYDCVVYIFSVLVGIHWLLTSDTLQLLDFFFRSPRES